MFHSTLAPSSNMNEASGEIRQGGGGAEVLPTKGKKPHPPSTVRLATRRCPLVCFRGRRATDRAGVPMPSRGARGDH